MKDHRSKIDPLWSSTSNYALIIGGIAHDLNNTLTAITGYAKLIDFKLKGISFEGKEYIQKSLLPIINGAEQADKLTNYLLSISRGFYKKPVEETLFVNAKTALETIKKTRYWDSKKFKLRVRGAKTLTTLPIPIPIFTLIMNEIIANSYKAAQKIDRQVSLTISISYIPNGSMLKIVAKDTGAGFPEDIIANDSYLSKFSGLYIVSEIARRLKGWLLIQNDKKGGARLELALIV